MGNGCSAAFRLLPCLVLLSSFALGAPEDPKDVSKIPTVFVQTAKAAPLFDNLSYPARVASRINANLVAEADGVIYKILAPLGRAVRENDRIISLKHTDPVYDYRPLYLRSPVAGVVATMDVTEGSLVTKGQKLATITDPKKASVYLEVAMRDLPIFAPGMEGELTLNGIPAKFRAQVVGLSPQIDSATGTASCELSLMDMKNRTLPTGTLGRISFKVRERMGFRIPEYAVVYRNKKTYLRTVQSKKAKLEEVKLGTSERGLVEVTSGIKEGTEVVLRSSVFVAEGEAVNVQKAEPEKVD